MWCTTAVLSVVFSCYQVFGLGGDIPDVTTIYDIGHGKQSANDYSYISNPDFDDLPPIPSTVGSTPCITDVTSRVHARTNALGLGIINEKIQYMNSSFSDIPNIKCDINFSDDESYTQWFPTGTKLKHFYSLHGLPIRNGKPYRIENGIVLNRQNIGKLFLLFTEGSGNLNNENIYAVIRFEDKSASMFTNCYYGDYLYNNYELKVLDRDGYTAISIRCNEHYTTFTVNLQEYLTFNISREGNTLFIYRGTGDKKELLINYNFRSSINYFSVSSSEVTTDVMDNNFIAPKAHEVTSGDDIVSPIFTPQSNNLCLALVFHSSIKSPFPELNITALGLLPSDRQIVSSISNVKEGWNVRLVNVLLENLNPTTLRIAKSGRAEISIARIASCSPDGEEVIELPSSITVCPKDQRIHPWGIRNSSLQLYTTSTKILDTVEPITNSTNHCWNGGVLTSAGCACTPGFSGSSCEIGCGQNRFGQDCEGICSFHSEECRGLLLCTEFTGCRCAPGYHGDDCTQACAPGWYGNDCSERCGHCAENSACNIYTGECAVCEAGYLAPSCKTVSVYYGSKPELFTPTYGTIVVSFDPNNYVTHGEPPQLYQIQFREKGDEWKVYTSKSLQKSSDESEQKVSEKIEGLKSGILYQVRVLLIDAFILKYDGELVQAAEVLTKCDIPTSCDYKVEVFTNTTAITLKWEYVIGDDNWCPLETFELTWREGWKRHSIFTTATNFTLSGLVPGLPVEFKVRAKTSKDFAPYSKNIKISTQKHELPPVRNLYVKSSQSTSMELLWEPPRGTEDSKLRYTISYKCEDRPACSPGCQNVSEGQLTQEGTSITLSPLLPFTVYLVSVKAEGGPESSIHVGTAKVVPTEIPFLSLQRPVRTNTSVTVFWDQGPVCTGYQLGYHYQLTKASDTLKILASGFTKETNASFHNLTASTEYVVRVFVHTVAGWNPLSYLAININTSATVPDAVRNLTVYKKGRGILGLRWALPQAIYGQLKSFTVSHSLGQEIVSHTIEPSHCTMWPELYCYTIEGLRSNRRYNVSVSARNSEVAEDGQLSFTSAVTKEGPPSAPVNLKVTNSSSTSVELEWNYPEMANGIIRSFLISVEETEMYDQENCCQMYPIVETSVKEESQIYSTEVSGLHPASTYFVSVSAKTVGLGPSQSLVASTRPPHLPLTTLPNVLSTVPEVSWLPQEKLPEVNNSDVYASLIRGHLLLAVLNETQPAVVNPGAITDPKLDLLLNQMIGKPFYFITEYNQNDDVDVSEPLANSDSPWGRPPESLSRDVSYQLVATQVLEYNGVYNVDLRYSQPLTLI